MKTIKGFSQNANYYNCQLFHFLFIFLLFRFVNVTVQDCQKPKRVFLKGLFET